jgi:hypothetical protein
VCFSLERLRQSVIAKYITTTLSSLIFLNIKGSSKELKNTDLKKFCSSINNYIKGKGGFETFVLQYKYIKVDLIIFNSGNAIPSFFASVLYKMHFASLRTDT